MECITGRGGAHKYFINICWAQFQICLFSNIKWEAKYFISGKLKLWAAAYRTFLPCFSLEDLRGWSPYSELQRTFFFWSLFCWLWYIVLLTSWYCRTLVIKSIINCIWERRPFVDNGVEFLPESRKLKQIGLILSLM